MKPTTARQTQILEFIKRFITQNGYSPSLRTIGKEIDLSPSVILTHLENMEDSGLIERMPNKARSIRIVDQEDPRDQMIADLIEALEWYAEARAYEGRFSPKGNGIEEPPIVFDGGERARQAIQKARIVTNG